MIKLEKVMNQSKLFLGEEISLNSNIVIEKKRQVENYEIMHMEKKVT